MKRDSGEARKWKHKGGEIETGRQSGADGERTERERKREGRKEGKEGGGEEQREKANVDPKTGGVDSREDLRPLPNSASHLLPLQAPSILPAPPALPPFALPPLGSKCPFFLAYAPPLLQPPPRPHPQQCSDVPR